MQRPNGQQQNRLPGGIPPDVASRVASGASLYTNVSIGTTISNDSPQASTSSFVDTLTYEAVLKVILLEYKNEPRFKKKQILTPTVSRSPSPQRPVATRNYAQDKAAKRQSWFRHSNESTDSVPPEAIAKLKGTLTDIAVGKNNQFQDPLTKRCFLHLYNELLRPGAEFENVEEILVLFIGAATKEIKLYSEANKTNTDVFKLADTFISMFVRILRSCKNSEDSINRLEDSRKSFKKSTTTSYNQPSNLQVPGSSQQEVQIVPSYRLSEISAAKLAGEIFGIDQLKVQQDIIRLKDVATEKELLGDLRLLSERLKKNEAAFNPDDFDNYDAYFSWKNEENKNLAELISKLDGGLKVEIPNSLKFIPNDNRSALSDLLVRCLQYENTDITMISNATKGLIQSCCKYWRIDRVSEATLLFQAAHITILKSVDNEIDTERTEALFGILYRLFADAREPHLWSKIDKKTWITNLSNSFIQVMSSLRSLLTAIYGAKAPKFTPILRILYEFIEADPMYHIIAKSGLPQRWIKRLKNSVLSTTESKYVEILEGIPRDSSLDWIHIKETSEKIYRHIQQLQKKFPKPLLDTIYIPNEAGFLFIKLYSEDIKNMLSHVEHYTLKNPSRGVDPVDALETYAELKDLRDIYNQVKPQSTVFPFDLEAFFFKYLRDVCDTSIKRILPVVKQSIEHDSFEPLNLDQDIGYSSSVLDTFKMINEIISMFKNYGWANEKHMAIIYTLILRSVSDAIVYYAGRIKLFILEDLREVAAVQPVEDQKKNSAWLFNEMKAAVSGGSKLTAPPPYSFKPRTCVALNNLSQVRKQLNEIESLLDPERIKLLASAEKPNKTKTNIFTVRIVRAENIKPSGSDGFSNSYVVLVDTNERKEIGKTKVVPKTLNPYYEEEFELEQNNNTTRSLTATVWNRGSKLTSQELLGRAVLQLDPHKFRNDGVPEEITRDLDIQGRLIFEVSLESEKDDAIYSIGRANRTIIRTMETSFNLIVDKFSVFITDSFSRQTLKSICGNNGLKVPTSEETKDAILPLFDYLNSNLQVLASTLDEDILIKVMIQAWKVILNSADTLLLPALASVKVINLLLDNSTWKDSLSNAVANVTNSVVIPGYGRSLTPIEVDAIFVWLNSLCEFFYNDGAGPDLTILKDVHFQRILLVQKFYDASPKYLMGEVERLTPLVLKAIKARNFLGDENEEYGSALKSKSKTFARRKTIAAYGSSKRRAEAEKVVKEADAFTGTFDIYTEDIILRVLMSKDQRQFVHKRITEREKIAQSFVTERLARLAVHGRRR